MLRQESDPDAFFGNKVTRAKWAESRLAFDPWEEALPRGFTVTGSQWADVIGDGNLELPQVKNHILFVYQGRNAIYRSPKVAGGSVSFLNYNATPGMQDFLLETARFELNPIAYDVDGDGSAEVVLAASKGMGRFLPGMPTGVDESWLAIVGHDQGLFSTRPLSRTFENPIQGLGLTPNGLFFLVKDELPRTERAGKGTIYRFPLYRR